MVFRFPLPREGEVTGNGAFMGIMRHGNAGPDKALETELFKQAILVFRRAILTDLISVAELSVTS